MELFDFLFPEHAEVEQLRNISKALSSPLNKNKRVNELRADVNFLSLVVMVLIKKAAANGDFSMEEFLRLCQEVDLLDGNKDGALNIDFLRGALGILKEKTPKAKKVRKMVPKNRNKKVKY